MSAPIMKSYDHGRCPPQMEPRHAKGNGTKMGRPSVSTDLWSITSRWPGGVANHSTPRGAPAGSVETHTSKPTGSGTLTDSDSYVGCCSPSAVNPRATAGPRFS